MSARQPRHAAPSSRTVLVAAAIGVVITLMGSVWALASGPGEEPKGSPPMPVTVTELPPVEISATPAVDPCADPAVTKALGAGDDAAAIAAFGGGEAFRLAVSSGTAPCVSLSDPAHEWVVVNKARPLDPARYAPASLGGTGLRTTTGSGEARPVVSQALAQLAKGSADAGAGAIGVNNGYRSYDLQQRTYSTHVRNRGQAWADSESARPGHSEHQTGLALDIVACSPGCGEIQGFTGTPQAQWVAAHAWEYGFIVRYEDGRTAVTGYVHEAWHVRYIGKELAAAYHAGGFHTLEEFFGLPAAPDYPH
ncbi:M15 family metallopeptidase [Microbacterium sp.]|uniref:M15 family metallopeptidase n=1 Tax=Microbacterium sp. TaxID=51671 RepID=UPI0033425E17